MILMMGNMLFVILNFFALLVLHRVLCRNGRVRQALPGVWGQCRRSRVSRSRRLGYRAHEDSATSEGSMFIDHCKFHSEFHFRLHWISGIYLKSSFWRIAGLPTVDTARHLDAADGLWVHSCGFHERGLLRQVFSGQPCWHVASGGWPVSGTRGQGPIGEDQLLHQLLWTSVQEEDEDLWKWASLNHNLHLIWAEVS